MEFSKLCRKCLLPTGSGKDELCKLCKPKKIRTDTEINYAVFEGERYVVTIEKWNGNLYKRVYDKEMEWQVGTVELLGSEKEMLGLELPDLPRFNL